MSEKPKLSFGVGLIITKARIELSGKETEKYPRNFFTIITVWMVILWSFSSNLRHINN